MQTIRFLLLAICVAALISVSGNDVQGQRSTTARSVEISSTQSQYEVGQHVKFSAAAKDETGLTINEKPAFWFAAPFDLAAIDREGLASFYQPGEVTIGVLISGKPFFKKITINAAKPSRVVITPIASPVVVGSTLPLTATALLASGDPRRDAKISWSSETPQVARVDAAGVVTGVAPGSATLRASSGSASGTISLTVAANTVTSLSISPASSNVSTGDVVHLKATASGGSFAPHWAVSGDGATVDAEGSFVADLPGTYLITASIGDRSAGASVVVKPRNAERSLQVVGRAPLKDVQAAEEWIIGSYAYLSTISDHFLVFDISDPTHPKQTDKIKVDARLINDISTTPDGKILVISRENASNRKNGIAFYDTSDPAHPKLISDYTATVTGGVHSAFVDSHYVYLTDDATGSMRVIDFSDAKNPKEVARWEVKNDVANAVKSDEGVQIHGRYLHDLQVKDGLAYLAYWRDGLVILDVGKGIKGGSPENPKLVSQLHFNHNELYGNGWLAGSHSVFRYKDYVFVGDEVFPAIFDIHAKPRIPVRGIMHVVDVSDIDHPRKVAEYPVPEAGAHNMWVEDDVLYMGYYNGGARVLDVSGELRGDLYRQGREIGRIWTGDADGFRTNQPFCWGAQPHKGLVYFNDINTGLWIVKVGDPIDKGSTTTPGN